MIRMKWQAWDSWGKESARLAECSIATVNAAENAEAMEATWKNLCIAVAQIIAFWLDKMQVDLALIKES